MLTSKCHNAPAWAIETENGSYYACVVCGRPCSLELDTCEKESMNATGN